MQTCGSDKKIAMPVQTRAGGQPQAASKVYKPKAPEPRQQQFPGRRRQIKTYGRRTAPQRSDQTLTQMNFVSSEVQQELQLLNSSSGEDQVEPPVRKRPGQKTARTDRRRTLGDVEEDTEYDESRTKKRRKTLGDPPNASGSFHTQTLTQFLSASSKDEDDWKIPETDDEKADDTGIVQETPKKVKEENRGLSVTLLAQTKTATPSNRMTKVEIPSSTSPATPLLLLRYSPSREPSPLKNKSLNISARASARKSTARISTNFVVQDSYSTSHSSPVTPTPRAKAKAASKKMDTPARRLRFELPEDKENITPGRTKPKPPKPVVPRSAQRQPLSEVPDSDDEVEIENEDGTDASVSTILEHVVTRRHATDDMFIHAEEEVAPNETGEADYDAGVETQAILASSEDRPSLESGTQDQPEMPLGQVSSPPADTKNRNTVRSTPIADSADDEIVEQTPTRQPRSQPTQDHTQGLTQGMESQRVPLETIKATGPITDKSDIIVSIYGEHVQRMVQRIKTHEFRSWKFPNTVHRVWIYITKPESQLKYMCIFGPPKGRGEIDETGFGNAEFNRGLKRSTVAHEVLDMYELNNPVSYAIMKQYGWPTAPQKFAYVPPAVVGQLTSNLRCALWDEEDEGVVRSSPNVTESQELADQIRSDIDHVTQLESSDQTVVIPSSPPPPRARSMGKRLATSRPSNGSTKPPPPQTMSASSLRSQPAAYSQRSYRGVRPSQASTISQASSSSPIVSPEKSVPLPSMAGAQRSAPTQLPLTSSPTTHRHSLRSSQFPTESQMLPDSLLRGDFQEPPPIIWDSADDESD